MYFLDCEFDGHKGELISMALVPHDTGPSFYEVINVEVKDEWVKKNVIPITNGTPIDKQLFTFRLIKFLKHYVAGEEVVADSPADIIYLMDMLHGLDDTGKYFYEPVPLTCTYVNSGRLRPDTPHNALSDAKALRDWYMNHREIMTRS